MLKIASEEARLAAEFGIQVGRWSQYADVKDLPFGAMWCVIEPGASSNPDRHPEVEFAVIVGGTARYCAGAEQIEAGAGSVVLLDSEEGHVIHNPSPTEPLTILSLYWMPETATADSGADDVR